MSTKEEQRRKTICNFFDNHPDWKKSDIVSHFVEQGENRSSVYRTLAIYGERKTTERKSGSGKKCSLSDSIVRARLRKITDGKIAKSYRELGKKFQCDGKTVKKYLNDMGIQKKCRKNKATVSEAQEITQKSRLRSLVKKTFHAKNNVVCIMDDESYFTMDGNEWQGKHYFEGKRPIDDNIKFVEHTKFPKKVLLWLAISQHGMSEPEFFESGLAVNSERYINYCLPKVKEFINKKHSTLKVIFWPDLASSHYAKKTLEAMDSFQIPYVCKQENPPNVPQLRPIEDFWANLKRRVYGNNFRPKTTKTLIKKIRIELKSMPTSIFSKAMEKVPQNCRKAARLGPNIFLH